LTIRRFRTLIAVARHGSFGAASEAVHITQAAVSLQMKSLEYELRVGLFDRSRRPPALNPAGLALVAKARDVVGAYDDMISAVGSDDGLAGDLTIGVILP
jgi:DNA-binding transcriptional LysR family regulator